MEKTLIVGGVIPDVLMLTRQLTLAKDRAARRILSNLDHLRWDLDLHKLLGFGRVLQR